LPQQKHIYGLGKAALPVLVEDGTADPDIVATRSRIHELTQLFLKHELMIVELLQGGLIDERFGRATWLSRFCHLQ